ncbi:MAG: hypothetical protein KME17_23845 [Cyanosarcina radialis HA8281-LM2]|jgi:hypothetical protein|nr:hypothetical protein [Cyanosarcina radialis HA8281-LM2]
MTNNFANRFDSFYGAMHSDTLYRDWVYVDEADNLPPGERTSYYRPVPARPEAEDIEPEPLSTTDAESTFDSLDRDLEF